MARPTDDDRLLALRIAKTGIRVRLKEAAIDRLAWDFCSHLDHHGVEYAIIGGYVAILLGRPRESEDVDLFCKALSFSAFSKLHASLGKAFDCLTPGPARRLFDDYLNAGPESTSVRYARRDQFYPNIEFKFAGKPLDHRALRRRIPVDANGRKLYIGPLEEMIAFKLWMGSQKDFEDARWIYRSARGHLNEATIRETAQALGITEAKGRRVLGR
jgi:predicted nucleotidyltransferase